MEYNGYTIKHDGTYGMYSIIIGARGGQVPRTLKGMYTNPKQAKAAIDMYLRIKEAEGSKPLRPKKVKLTPREGKYATDSESRD